MNSGDGMSNAITIILPLPPKWLRPNVRPHWRVKSKAIRKYRQLGADEGAIAIFGKKGDLGVPWTDARVEVTWFHRTHSKPDRDNIIAMIKAPIDGLVDAGVLIDDSELEYASPKREQDAKRPRIEITIKQLLPQFKNRHIDITGGVSSEDHVRRLRDDD